MGSKRFKRLNYALSALKNPDGSGGEPTPPAGSVAANYQELKAGKKVLKYPRIGTDSNPGELLEVTVLPFFYGGADDSGVIVPFSKRVKEEESFSSIAGASNHVVVDIETHQKARNFKPAQVVITKQKSSPVEKTSQITGIKYKQFSDGSFTFPYGASTTEKAEGNVRKGIITAAKAIDGLSYSFSSEKV